MTEREIDAEFSDLIEDFEGTPKGQYHESYSYCYFKNGELRGVFDLFRSDDGGLIVLLSEYPVKPNSSTLTLHSGKEGIVHALDDQYYPTKFLAKYSVPLDYALSEVKYFALNFKVRDAIWHPFTHIDPEGVETPTG